jgi:hypothetical protein
VVGRAKRISMNAEMIRSLVIIGLRHVAPLVGGAGVVSDDQIQQVAGALILLGSVAYHVYQRYQGQKARA